MLRHLGYWAEREKDWKKVVEFLDRVWPRQLVARTSRAAAVLAGLAMSAGDQMPEVTRAVLPFLAVADVRWTDPMPIRLSHDDIVERFPAEHLAILHATLSVDPGSWAWGTNGLIERLGKIEIMRSDPRLIELRRRMGGH